MFKFVSYLMAVALVVEGLFWGYMLYTFKKPVSSAVAQSSFVLPTKKADPCPWWECSPDSRTPAQWQAQCQPVWARSPTGALGMVCTSSVNPRDAHWMLPKGWVYI